MPNSAENTGATSRPKIVVLCGSSKFVDVMAVCGWLIERDEGAITMGLHLLPLWYCGQIDDHIAEHQGVQFQMDDLHLRKIDLADEVFVVNCRDYIGQSTRREIEYAQRLGKPLRWFTHDPIGEQVTTVLTEKRLPAQAEHLHELFIDQIQFSRRTFGEGKRTGANTSHIAKELQEIRANPADTSEWVDVILLALDGYWRHGGDPTAIMTALRAKLDTNKARKWPTPISEDIPVEHVRSAH